MLHVMIHLLEITAVVRVLKRGRKTGEAWPAVFRFSGVPLIRRASRDTCPDSRCLAMLDISLPLLSLRDISLSPLSRYARHLPLIRGVGPLTGGIGPLIRGVGPQGEAWREMVEKPSL